MNLTSLRDHLEKVHAFSVIARTGSFRKAALVLRLSQPSLSRSVKVLEDALDAPLLRRSRQGVHLTAAGRSLLEFNGRVAVELEKVEHRIRSSPSALSAKVIVGTYSSLAIRVWPSFVRNVARKHPGISISLKTDCNDSTLQGMLRSSQLDLVVSVAPTRDPELVQHALYRDSFRLYCATRRKDLFSAATRSVRISDLSQIPFVLVPTAVYEPGRTLERLALESGLLSRQQLYELDSFEAAKEFICEGIGLGLLPKWVAHPALKQGLLRELRVVGLPIPLGAHAIMAVYRKSDLGDPAMQVLIKEMGDFFRKAHL